VFDETFTTFDGVQIIMNNWDAVGGAESTERVKAVANPDNLSYLAVALFSLKKHGIDFSSGYAVRIH
jgi:hypothetical protein